MLPIACAAGCCNVCDGIAVQAAAVAMLLLRVPAGLLMHGPHPHGRVPAISAQVAHGTSPLTVLVLCAVTHLLLTAVWCWLQLRLLLKITMSL